MEGLINYHEIHYQRTEWKGDKKEEVNGVL